MSYGNGSLNLPPAVPSNISPNPSQRITAEQSRLSTEVTLDDNIIRISVPTSPRHQTPVGVYFIPNKSSVSSQVTLGRGLQPAQCVSPTHVLGWFRCLTRHSSPAAPTENLKHNGDNLLSSSWWAQGMDLSSSINTWTFMSEGCIHSLRRPVLLWDYYTYYCAANSNTCSWDVLD